MSDARINGPAYQNPIYPHSFPDPYVLKYCGEYWAYCTGIWHDGRCFGVLRSSDLVHWEERLGAMAPLPGDWPQYWAPEVTYSNGTFYLYYSAGNELNMQIRVAISDSPGGPFVDTGRRLTMEEFAIDPHVFTDIDGERYLFYATDFLDHTRVGTGTVRDRMLDPYTLAGQPQPVSRAQYDWQIYDPHRLEKGGVCWHTVEGPFVLTHKGRYYQMFSGGNWRNPSYGVSYAVADSVSAPGEWAQAADGESGLPILQTVPGAVIGPGHNSVVRGPDNRQLYCVYHRWVSDQRVMAIDRLEWAGGRLIVMGPTSTAQPAPIAPTVSLSPDVADPGPGWRFSSGAWSVGEGRLMQTDVTTSAEVRYALDEPAFVGEVSLRALSEPRGGARYGVGLNGAGGPLLRCSIQPIDYIAAATWLGENGWIVQEFKLPPAFNYQTYHLVRVVTDGRQARVHLAESGIECRACLHEYPSEVTLQTEGVAAAFAGFALTLGWEDLFQQPSVGPADLGWSGTGNWLIRNQQLWHVGSEAAAIVRKGPLLADYELVINARLESAERDGCYGFYPALLPAAEGPLMTVRYRDGWAVVVRWLEREAAFPLPETFNPYTDQHFRLRKEQGRIELRWETCLVGSMDAPREATQIGLYAHRAVAAFDMVRVTALPDQR